MLVVERTLESPVRSLFVAVVLGLLGVVVLAWVSLLFEMPPDGRACYYELDVGSGAGGIGQEAIDWNLGVFPGRVCEYEIDGLAEPQVYARTSLFRDLWPLVAGALAMGVYVVLRSASWLATRTSATDDVP